MKKSWLPDQSAVLPVAMVLLLLGSIIVCQPRAAIAKVKPKKQAASTATPTPALSPAKPSAISKELDAVLSAMDGASANFKNAQADLQWDEFDAAAGQTETQTGTIYFRRKKNETEMAAHFDTPKKIVVFANGNLRLYQAGLDQVTEYPVGKDRSDVESFLSIGFGGRGHELLQSFDVTYDGSETIDGVKTEKLILVPKTPKVKHMLEKLILWIDPKRSISLKQQFFEPSGNHRFAHYTSIRYGSGIPEDKFKLPTTAHTKIVHPE